MSDPSSKEEIESVLIFGGSGGFGRAFAERFSEIGVSVTTSDVINGSDIQANICVDPDVFLPALSGSDLILLCLPEAPACQVLKALDGRIEDKLVVDICSVKSVIADVAKSHCQENEYVTFHPMFGPDRPFTGSNGVFMPIREGFLSNTFRTRLESFGLNIIDTDVETHDRVTSLVQVATHAVLATFANLRLQYEVPEEMVQAFATPVFAELDRVSQGMVSENPELYHNIQTANPWGDEARAKLKLALHETLAELSSENPEETQALFERVRRS